MTTSLAEEALGGPDCSDTDEQSNDLAETITAVSAMIDAYCQRSSESSSSEARTFAATNTTLIRFGPFNDLVSASAVKTDTTGDGTVRHDDHRLRAGAAQHRWP